jgi:hypothetical protein
MRKRRCQNASETCEGLTIMSDDSSRKDKIIDKGDLVTKFGNQTTMNKFSQASTFLEEKLACGFLKTCGKSLGNLQSLKG